MFSEKSAYVRGLEIGGSAPVRIQTMYDSALANVDHGKLLERITLLKAMGCDLIRFSYISSDDKDAFSEICKRSVMPVVADIHFDYKMALEALSAGADKVRINPGNIGAKWKSEEVFRAAKDRGAAVRIGLNSGSLPKRDDNLKTALLMCETAKEYAAWAEAVGFENLVISLKSSCVEETLEANRKLAPSLPYPIHLGVTEAGDAVTSSVRSSIALSKLLEEGIGDTLRISITGSLEQEVQAASELLRTVGLKKDGVRIVSCPRCGRHSFDTQGFLSQVQLRLLSLDKDLTVAFMGCQVNGPGEAKGADVAITGIGKKVFLYVKGELKQEVNSNEAEDALFKAIEEL